MCKKVENGNTSSPWLFSSFRTILYLHCIYVSIFSYCNCAAIMHCFKNRTERKLHIFVHFCNYPLNTEHPLRFEDDRFDEALEFCKKSSEFEKAKDCLAEAYRLPKLDKSDRRSVEIWFKRMLFKCCENVCYRIFRL